MVIDFNEAFRVVLAVMNNAVPFPEHFRKELPAIVSHWLHNPIKDPLILGKAEGEKWRGFLSAYERLSHERFFIQKNSAALSRTGLKVDFTGFPFPPTEEKPKFKFIDLFSGIGGFRIALQNLGGKCVFSCDNDRMAKETYYKNFGEYPFGDIRKFTGKSITDEELAEFIPDHDILAAGFPCQPFSKAGVSARNALKKENGFSCRDQGTLFFDILRIAKVKRPKVLFLENVRNLERHDGGRTIQKIKNAIERDLGYSFYMEVIDASSVVPQKRQRCYMVCFRNKRLKFSFPKMNGASKPLRDILETSPSISYTISKRLWVGHQSRTIRNVSRGVGFTAFKADLNKPANTLVSRYGKDGKECLVPQRGKKPRLLTPRECARLQGFPDSFILPQFKLTAYKKFGNSVVVPVVEKIASKFIPQCS